MICILAGNKDEAEMFAEGHQLSKQEWFYPKDEFDLHKRSNFHVLVIGTAGQNVPSSYFERIFNLAKMRGKIGRL